MKKKFIVALHTESWSQVLSEMEKIVEGGADGVVLVNNGFKILCDQEYPNLFDMTIAVREKYPHLFVGINPLDIETVRQALQKTYLIQRRYPAKKVFDFIWTDGNAILEKDGNATLNLDIQDLLKRETFNSSDGISYFGSVAFKYQPQPKNLELVAREAAKHFSVVVTSGSGTGKPADPEKVRLIKSYIGYVPLALASGTKKDNIVLYAPYVDIFIVGTSLLVDPNNDFLYDEKKIADFSKKIKEL